MPAAADSTSVQLDEVGQPGDREDLPVVVGKATGDDLPPVRPCPGQHADDQRDPRGVDVVDSREVEQQARSGTGRYGTVVAGAQDGRCRAVHLTANLDD